jgi:tetratricopeptide (TPR) repeat protein
MGAVYLATVEGDAPGLARGTKVAVKVVHAHLLATPGFFKRFMREADVGKSVRHENVVRTLDVDATVADGKNVHYLVMEYVEGRTLREMLRDLKTVPEALLRELASQIASGLAAIHEAGIVHRDMKPENVLVTKDHQVRIMDLGVARLQEATVAITKEGQFAGSLLYASPEQFRHEQVGPPTDLYSLGVMLYELASGSNPFERDNAAQVISAHLNLEPRPLREVAADVSPFFAEVATSLLAKAPAGRFGSATELRRVLVDGESSAWWKARETVVREREHRLPPIQVRRETALHGRETELALFAEAWKNAQQGRGSTIFVEGEAGIGKTRLVDAFVKSIGPGDFHVLYGSYPPSGGAGGLSDAITEKFGRAALADALKPHLAVTPTLVPGFAAMVKHEAPPSGSEPLTGDAIQAVFCHLAKSLATEKPTLWVVDEMHFAPEDSRHAVLALARAVEPLRMLLVVTARPGLPDDEIAHFSRLQNFRRTTLGRLSPRQIIELLRDAFKSDALADRLGAKIAFKSDGVPFFVFEMIRGLKDGQFIRQQADGTYVETQVVSDIEVPSAVRDLIEGRLKDLTKEERAILDVGAVMGFEFDPDLVARVLETKRILVLQTLADLERRSGVVRAAGKQYRFDHHQIQEILHRGLSDSLREEYHALLAEAFTAREKLDGKDPKDVPGEAAVFLATHGLGGSRPADALPLLTRALDHLEGAYRNAAAIELAERALAAVGVVTGIDRAKLVMRRATRLVVLGRTDEALAAHEEAVSLADESGDRALRARARRLLGSALSDTRARFDEADVQISKALELVRSAGDAAEDTACVAARGQLDVLRGRMPDAKAALERALAGATAAADREAESRILMSMAMIGWQTGDFSAAEERAQRASVISTTLCDRMGQQRAAAISAILHWCRGRFAAALAEYSRAQDLARAVGFRQGEAVALVNIGSALSEIGDGRRAVAVVQEARAVFRAIGARRGEIHVLANLGGAEEAMGNRDRAEEHYRAALTLSRELGYASGIVASLAALGSVMGRDGRDGEAARHLDEAIAVAGESGFTQDRVLSLCMRAALPGGDVPAARAALSSGEDQLALTKRIGARFSLWEAAHDPADLAAAWRELQFLRDHAPEDNKVTVMENVSLHREIAAAAKEAGL